MYSITDFSQKKITMKKYIILLLSVIVLKLNAGTIPVGISSENIFTWSVWENEKGVLKHYLYVFNKKSKEVKFQIKLKKYRPSGADFVEVKTDKEIYKTYLAPTRITKLDYPTTMDKMSFMEVFEDGKSIGLLSYNLDEPVRSFVDNKFKFYSNAGIDGSKENIWMRFESIFNPTTEVTFSSNLKNPDEVCFIKIINPKTEVVKTYQGVLDSLQGTDPSIIKLDKTSAIQSTKLESDLGQEKFILIPVLLQGKQSKKKTFQSAIQLPVYKE
jgi:hypothetical protein